jgi:predicted RNA-binding protein with PIN domain
MLYLIDGYNLLYALDAAPARVGPRGLEKARGRLLALLRAAHGDEAGAVTVVFDARGAPPGAPTAADFHGLHVVFARGQEADDLIEAAIRQAAAPRRLTVVSDDRRIQQAAGRRRCRVLGCSEYLDELERQPPRVQPAEPIKPPPPADHETQDWLREFADLADDPALKELSDPPEFLEGDERPPSSS